MRLTSSRCCPQADALSAAGLRKPPRNCRFCCPLKLTPERTVNHPKPVANVIEQLRRTGPFRRSVVAITSELPAIRPQSRIEPTKPADQLTFAFSYGLYFHYLLILSKLNHAHSPTN